MYIQEYGNKINIVKEPNNNTKSKYIAILIYHDCFLAQILQKIDYEFKDEGDESLYEHAVVPVVTEKIAEDLKKNIIANFEIKEIDKEMYDKVMNSRGPVSVRYYIDLSTQDTTKIEEQMKQLTRETQNVTTKTITNRNS